jgi:dTDP-4-amino-4,6-dideoxygalactose transaminase
MAGTRNVSSREGAAFGIGDEEFHRSFSSYAASRLARRLASRCNAEEVFAARRRNFEILSLLLPSRMRLVRSLPEGVCPLLFPALVQDKRAAARELAGRGIETFPFWSLAHPAVPREDFSDADFLRTHVLALPIHQALTTSDIEYLADSVIALSKKSEAPDKPKTASWPGTSEVPVKT